MLAGVHSELNLDVENFHKQEWGEDSPFSLQALRGQAVDKGVCCVITSPTFLFF